jgi:IclR family transcriptional regulator, KDG regulon repressor
MSAVTLDARTAAVEAEVSTKTGNHVRLPAVDRAINLFELLANSENGLTLSDLSRRLNIPKSTTHYLIYTLATRGYVQEGPSGRYCLGFCFTKLANAHTAESELRKIATPYLRKLASKLNLTAALTVLRGAQSTVIGTVTSEQGEGGGAWIGRHIDLHCNAQGKALIAYLSDEELHRIFAGREFAPFTPKTILSLPALKVQLADVRAKGYAICDEEYFQGFRAVAAPVFASLQTVIAAISVRGSVQKIPSPRMPQLGLELVSASREISMLLCRY